MDLATSKPDFDSLEWNLALGVIWSAIILLYLA